MAAWTKHLILVFLYLLLEDADSYEIGALPATCIERGQPHHGRNPQSTVPPYRIHVDKLEINPGDAVKVTLEALSETEPFTGFQVVATWAYNDKLREELPGNFTNLPPNSQGQHWYYDDFNRVACVTHTDSSPKLKVELMWHAPSQLKGDVIFRSGFVKNYEVFWGNVPSQKIKSLVVDQDDKQDPTEVSDSFHDIELSEGCGETKGCFLYPDSCEGEDCDVAVTWQYDQDKQQFLFEVLGTEDAYVALGWSHDKWMGEDETIHCVANGAALNLFYGYSPEYYNIRNKVSSNFTDIEIQKKDGRVQCRFRKSATDVLVYPPYLSFTLDMRIPQYLQVSWGSTYPGGEIPKKHADIPLQSKEKIDFTKNKIVRGRGLVDKIVIHAIFGVLGYLFFTSIGVIVARHFKKVLSRMSCGLPLWLQLHRAVLILAVCCIAVCIIVIFVHLEKWTEVASTHAVLCLVSVGLMLLQVLMGFLRPNPDSTLRRLYNWTHSFFGFAAYVVAVVCIFLGVNIPYMDWKFKRAMFSVLGAWVGFQVLFVIILTVRDRVKQDASERKGHDQNNSSNTLTISEYPTKTQNSSTGNRLNLAMFLLYCLIQIVMAIVALYYISMY